MQTAPRHDVDMTELERSIRRSGVITLIALAIAVPLAYQALSRWFELPVAPAARLSFALQANVIVLFCVLVAVGLVSTGRRFSPADAGGAAAGPPSAKLALRVAFLQNTLEQAVLACGLYLALATLFAGPGLSLIVVGVVFFVIGRILFYRGYARGPAHHRALGMTLTMMPTLLGYLLVVVLMIASWF